MRCRDTRISQLVTLVYFNHWGSLDRVLGLRGGSGAGWYVDSLGGSGKGLFKSVDRESLGLACMLFAGELEWPLSIGARGGRANAARS